MKEETFETTDLYFGCYLKANNIKLKSIEKTDSDKCKFIFYKQDEVKDLITKWYSNETDFVRKLMQVNAELRYQLQIERKRIL